MFSKSAQTKVSAGRPKILDTSVIIDGRILDLLPYGFHRRQNSYSDLCSPMSLGILRILLILLKETEAEEDLIYLTRIQNNWMFLS